MLGVATALIAYYLLSWQRQQIKKKEKEEFSLSMLPKLTLSKYNKKKDVFLLYFLFSLRKIKFRHLKKKMKSKNMLVLSTN